MSGKVMVVSYNPIDGVSRGRTERGNAIAYSGNWDFDRFYSATLVAGAFGSLSDLFAASADQHDAADASLDEVQQALVGDLPNVSTFYVYVGYSAMKGALHFIRKLKELGKVVHMVACDCDRESKIEFAERLGIDITWASCSGSLECGKIFAEHAAQPAAV